MERRHAYTNSYKLKVIKFAKEHGNRTAAKYFGPPPTEKMVRAWRKQEEEIKKSDKLKHNLRKPKTKWIDIEKELKTWVLEQRSGGYAVSTKNIIFEARARAASKGYDGFCGTTGWCYRFMKRNGLAMRTRTKIAQKMPVEYANKITEFHRYVLNARKEINYEMCQIANMDETPMTFDVPSNKTVDSKGVKSVTIKTSGNEKSHFTVVLSCCADGFKLPPLLIFKRKTYPKESIPPGIFIHVHPKGWMDEDGIKLWLEKVWVCRPGGHIRKPSLLVWDQFRSHLTKVTKYRVGKLETKLAVIPGGLTYQLQPLDVSINKPFKDHMREEWKKWMLLPGHDLTPTGRMKRPSISHVCTWVKNAWNEITPELIIRSFKKCGISNALDGTEDDLLCEKTDTADSESFNGSESFTDTSEGVYYEHSDDTNNNFSVPKD